MKRYCEMCGEEVETKVITKQEVYTVLGEDITVEAQVLVCADCHEELYCEELDHATLTAAYNTYRRCHKLLLPTEIKEIREMYHLSQRSFAKLLNWGDKTIRRYENGSIQDKVHNSLLMFLKYPKNMKVYLEENENLLDEKQLIKLLEVVENLIIASKPDDEINFAVHHFTMTPSIYNGFNSFDYKKFVAMVLYFTNKDRILQTTTLMNLLYCSDMIHFKENGVSLSGLQYRYSSYGPVPEKNYLLLGQLEVDNIIHIEFESDGNYEKHQIKANIDTIEGILSELEIDLLDRVYKRCINFTSQMHVNLDNEDLGISKPIPNEMVSYAYGSELML